MEGVLGKAVALPQCREGCFALLGVFPGDSTGLPPGGVGSHLAQAALPRGEHGVVELPPGFQVRTLACGLPCLDDQGQFEQKRRRLLFGGLLLPTCFGAHQPLAFLEGRTCIPIIAGQAPLCQAAWYFPLTSPKERRFIPRINHRGFRARLFVNGLVHVGRGMVYYLCGFDPHTPLSGERCSLTGIKIGRAAFSTIIKASPKRRVDTPGWAHPLPVSSSSLL